MPSVTVLPTENTTPAPEAEPAPFIGPVAPVPEGQTQISSDGTTIPDFAFDMDFSTPTASEEVVEDTTDTSATDALNAELTDTKNALAEKTQALLDALNKEAEGAVSTTDEAEALAESLQEAFERELAAAKALIPDPEISKQRAEDLREDEKLNIERERAALEARKNSAISGINSQFDVLEAEQARKQKKEKGTTSTGLARAGGYLGFTGSGQGVMTSLQVTHDQEITALASAKASAILAAQQAFEDQDFKLLQENIDSIGRLNDKIDERNDTHFSQMLQATQDARSTITTQMNMEKFERDKAFESLDIFAAGEEMPSPEEIGREAARLGMTPEAVTSAIKAKQATSAMEKKFANADEARAASADERATIKLINDYPSGQTFTLNGVTYEGKSVSKATGGAAPISYEDVYKDFNNNQWAQAMASAGLSVNDTYKFFGSELPPAIYADEMKLVNPDATEDDLFTLWTAERRDALGFNLRKDIVQMFPSERDRQVMLRQAQFEHNRDVLNDDQTLIKQTRPLGFEDLERIEEGRLNQLIEAGYRREKVETNLVTGAVGAAKDFLASFTQD